ncbi:hypothetical protein LTR65_003217 [Meristemomyces frigidus]
MDHPSLDPALEELPLQPDDEIDEADEAAESDADGDESDGGQFEQTRNAHTQQLKSRFEAIFHKYERDFTGVGDEIDLETGEIVVDNGHLENMRQELDSGKGASSQFFRDFAEDLEHADEDGSSGGSGSSEESGESGDESDVDTADEGSTSGGEAGNIPLDPLLQQLSDAAAGNVATNPLLSAPGPDVTGDSLFISEGEGQRDASRASEESQARSTDSINVLDIPAVKESLLALKTKSKSGHTVDSDAIQALGISIASQIAQFIGTGGRSKAESKRGKKRKDPIWDFPELPVDKRRRTAGDAAPQQPSLPLLSAAISPGRRVKEPRASLWAPVGHPLPRKRRPAAGPERPLHLAPDAPLPALDGEGAASQPQDELQNDVYITPLLKQCYNCGICATTTWRRGPDGALCNACGMYLYRYGLMKPPRPTTPEYETEAEEEQRDDSHYSANTSRRVKASATKARRFTVEEDALIIKLKELDRQTWEKIGRHFEGRSSFAVQCRYAKKLIGRPSEGRDALIEQGFSFDQGRGEVRNADFTEQDDELLVQLREESELEWAAIAERMPGQHRHTAESIEARYNVLLGILPGGTELGLQRPPQQKKPVDPDLPERSSRGFSSGEDELIVKLREVNKLPWSEVAQQIPSRSALALQKRYVRELDRRKDVVAKGGADPYAHIFEVEEESNFEHGEAGEERIRLEEKFVAHSSLTLLEETLLMRLKDEEGLSWEYIVDRMPGRSVLILRKRHQAIWAKRHLEREKAAVLETASVYDIPVSEGFVPDGNQQAPSLSQKKSKTYTSEEDRLILKLRGEGLTWERMSWHLPGRAADSLKAHWRYKLRHEQTFQPEGSEADTESAQAGESASVAQDDSLESIDPSLDQIGPSPLFLGTSGAETDPGPQHTGATETDSTAVPHVGSYTPTEDGSEISHDPYQHFAADSQSTAEALDARSEGSTPTLQPAKPGSRYSDQEQNIVRKLRDDGLEWPEIAAHLPGRSANSVYKHWTTHISDGKAGHNLLSASSGPAKKKEKKLLRQALDNGARRRSDAGLPHAGFPSTGTLFGTPISAPSGGMLPGAMVLGGTARPMNLFHSLLHRSPGGAAGTLSSPVRGRPLPEDSDQRGRQVTKTLLPSALPSAADFTATDVSDAVPARSAFVASYSDDSRAGTPEDFASVADTHSADQDDGDRVDEVDYSDHVSSFPETPMRSTGSHKPASPDATPFQPTPAPVTNYYTPARYNQNAMPYFTAPTAMMYSPLAPEPYAQHAPSQAVVDTAVEDDVLSPQQRAAASRARARHSWTPVIQSPQPLDDETVDESDAESDNIQEHLRSPPGVTLGSDKPPPFSWNDLITMALKSSPEQRMTVRDIYRYLEEKFPYFKACGNGWRNTLRQRMSMSDEFDGRGSGLTAIWGFADKRPVYVEPKRRPARPRKRQSCETASHEDASALPAESIPVQEPDVLRSTDDIEEATDAPRAAHESPPTEVALHDETTDAPALVQGLPAIQALARDGGNDAPLATTVPFGDDSIEVVAPPEGPALSQVTAPAAPADKLAPATVKRSRGRPRKVVSVPHDEGNNAPTATRPPMMDDLIEVAMPSGAAAAAPAASSDNLNPVPVKRGPGRPRKHEVVIKSTREKDGNNVKRQYTVFTDADRQRLAPLVLRGAANHEIEAALDGRPLLAFEAHRRTGRWNRFFSAYRHGQQGDAETSSVHGNEGGQNGHEGGSDSCGAEDARTQPAVKGTAIASCVDNSAIAEILDLASAGTTSQHRLGEGHVPSGIEAMLRIESTSEVTSAPDGTSTNGQASAAQDTYHLMTSDIYRDPESSPAMLRAGQKTEVREYPAEHGEDLEPESDGTGNTSNGSGRLAQLQAAFQMRQPSSPGFLLAVAEPNRPSPASVYGKSATGSSLAARLGQQDASTEGQSAVSYLPGAPLVTSSSRAGSVWRTSQTHMRLVDGSEDELA